MTTLEVTGGQPLHGEVTVSGAKNAATKMMLAALLTDQPVVLHNCPLISDVRVAAEIIQAVGGEVRFDGNTATITAANLKAAKVPRTNIPNRLSVLAISPLLHRLGSVDLPTVTGDRIGPRPVDFHLHNLMAMGAAVEERGDRYVATTVGLVGTNLELPYPSVMATENALLAGVLAHGRTTIEGAAIEPEIVDLIKLLQKMGAIIEFRANRTIIIDGVVSLHGAEHHVMPDRLEAASFGLAAIATGGDVLVKEARQDDLITFLNTIRRIGADYIIEDGGIRFKRNGGPLQAIEVETDTHPGFATDWQQPLVVLLTQANGLSVIHETVHEDRFGYVETLTRMGANIGVYSKCLGELPCRYRGQLCKHSAVIEGPTPLHATEIEIPDLRAGMAHVLAALVATGTSRITGVAHLMRGYENLLDKLHAIGADFTTTG